MDMRDDFDMDTEIVTWRNAERARLIAARLAMSAEQRMAHGAAIAASVAACLGDVAGKAISLYWPFRGEPDLRPLMEEFCRKGATCLLPVVVGKGAPLMFRAWRQGETLARGVWNIPYPEHGPDVRPDIVIAPLVGFDSGCYRLGYGGGFFDRTLAALPQLPDVIGVGYEQQRIASIRPQRHDIPMHVIVTEAGIQTRPGGNE